MEIPGQFCVQINNNCSKGELVFHRPTKNDPKPHWHYYPNGEGKAKDREADRWRDSSGADHFYPDPVYEFEFDECPCQNQTTDSSVTAIITLLTILLIIGTDGAGIVVVP
ncbi:MAG TPA: hypothetical protein PLL12_14015 [Aestuariivirga sp.]|nr:hypothetical protein [Aestuariivirga sp.]